jgi:outer membrane protein
MITHRDFHLPHPTLNAQASKAPARVCAALAILALSSATAAEAPSLTLEGAHEAALRNHPRITVAELSVLASRQVARQARAGFFPQVSANAVAVGTAEHDTRLSAVGALNNPSIFQRNAEGLMVSQLITDFGRTANLSQSATFRAKAEENNAQATREQILLAVDGAFYAALQAQAVTRVAQQTVAARQVFLDQVSSLASNKLRSELDVSFAKVNVEDAKLLLSKAQNDLDAAFAQLSNLMGLRQLQAFHLVEQPVPPPVSTNAAEFVQQALRSRPDILSLRNEQQSALKLARAERDARYPTIAAVGAAGVSPVHAPELRDDYAAAGVTITVPLYAGGLYAAKQKEAELHAEATGASLRDLENNVIRDVHLAWLGAQNAYDRLLISKKLLDNARESFELAQARYKNGISSIVELNQAELNEISAEIAYASTQYEYLLQRSTLSYQTGTLR